MSFYLSIRARQRPFPFDLDDHGRVMFSCNYEALGFNVGTWENDISDLLTSSGIATSNQILIGLLGSSEQIRTDSSGEVVSGAGPYVSIIDTGGSEPVRSHNGTKCERLSVQIVVRAVDHEVARDKSLEIYHELDGKSNIEM